MCWIKKQSMEKLKIQYICTTYCFLRDIYERKLILEKADNEKSKLVNQLKGIDKVV